MCLNTRFPMKMSICHTIIKIVYKFDKTQLHNSIFEGTYLILGLWNYDFRWEFLCRNILPLDWGLCLGVISLKYFILQRTFNGFLWTLRGLWKRVCFWIWGLWLWTCACSCKSDLIDCLSYNFLCTSILAQKFRDLVQKERSIRNDQTLPL